MSTNAGSVRVMMLIAVAMRMPVGKMSLVDCDLLVQVSPQAESGSAENCYMVD